MEFLLRLVATMAGIWASTRLGFLSCLAGAIITALVSSLVAGLVGARKGD